VTRAEDPEGVGGILGYPTTEGRLPKLVVVAVVWAAFGVVGLLTALLMRSAGIAVFGALCVLAGGGLYIGVRAKDQLESDEREYSTGGFAPGGSQDGPQVVEDDDVTGQDDDHAPSGGAARAREDDGSDDILDAEFTEHFDYDQSPADQDDGTGYDDEAEAWERYQEERHARESEAARAERDAEVVEDSDDGGSDGGGTSGDGSDEARTSRIPRDDGDRESSTGSGR
jgi:hypothetical protein